MKRFRFELAALALFSVLIGLVALAPTAAHADSCASGNVSGDFTLCQGWSVTGDVRIDYNNLPRGIATQGVVATCVQKSSCVGYAQWGAYVSNTTDMNDLGWVMINDHGCQGRCSTVNEWTCSPGGCSITATLPYTSAPTYPTANVAPATPFGIGANVYGGQIYYLNGALYCSGCNLIGATFAGTVQNGYVAYTTPTPTAVYPQPSGTTTTSWGNQPVTIAVGTNGWISISGLTGKNSNCWVPSTPPGGGSAVNALPNVQQVSNPPPTNQDLCGPFTINGQLMEIRTKDWYPGQWAKIQGIAIALNNPPGTACNSGNCVVDSTTAASVGGRVWYLALVGSSDSSVSPFTPFNTVNSGPTFVFPNTAETAVRA